MAAEQTHKTTSDAFVKALVVVLVVVILVGFFTGPSPRPHSSAVKSGLMQTSRAIALSLFVYSSDHDGRYPEGKTSTEVFQHLIDEKYVTDPTIFYVGYGHLFPTKLRPSSNVLKPENVCWDVTYGVDSSSPDSVPVVFLTGYKVTFQPNAAALPIAQSLTRSWSEWWNGISSDQIKGIAVATKGNYARWINADEDGSIPNFIPADFDPKGKTYRQLTP